MSISVRCPSCSAKINAPQHLAGQTAQCPRCKTSLQVPIADPPTTPLAATISRAAPPALPTDVQVAESVPMVPCPFCSESILETARKCRFCGEILDPVLRATAESKREKRQRRRPVVNVSVRAEPDDDAEAPAEPSRFPHTMHLILTVITCGVWSPIWLLHFTLHHAGNIIAGMLLVAFLGIIAAAITVIIANDGKLPLPDGHAIDFRKNMQPGPKQQPQQQPPKPAPVVNAISISAMELFRAYEENSVRADEQFKDKQLLVTGTIKSIGRDIVQTPYIAFETGNLILSVQCMFPGNAAEVGRLNQGDQVTVAGTCDGKLGNVILRRCRIN